MLSNPETRVIASRFMSLSPRLKSCEKFPKSPQGPARYPTIVYVSSCNSPSDVTMTCPLIEAIATTFAEKLRKREGRTEEERSAARFLFAETDRPIGRNISRRGGVEGALALSLSPRRRAGLVIQVHLFMRLSARSYKFQPASAVAQPCALSFSSRSGGGRESRETSERGESRALSSEERLSFETLRALSDRTRDLLRTRIAREGEGGWEWVGGEGRGKVS